MKRKIINELDNWRENPSRKPLILHGARQVGKTYILKAFAKKNFQQFHYFNFERSPKLCEYFAEDLSPKHILQSLSFHQNKTIDVKKDLIIFDEIQACPQALTSLKYFCEELPGIFLCCAGSLLGVYLGPVSYPVGKVEHLNMFPMTFYEFLQANKQTLLLDLLDNMSINSSIPTAAHEKFWTFLKHYFITGGLPEVVQLYCDHKEDLFSAFSKVREKQLDLIEDYFSDIAKHSGKINGMHIRRLLQNIPEQLGESQDGSAKKFRFKKAIPGVDRFSKLQNAIDWLDSAGLILKTNIVNKAAQPLKAYVTENAFKLYLFDIGILGALSDLEPKILLNYDYGSYKGFYAENFVAQELKANSFLNLFCWKEKTAEIEFLQSVENTLIPIEVKSGWVTRAKSLWVFAEKYQPPYRVLFSAQPMKIDQQNQLQRLPLYLAGSFPLTKRSALQ